MFPHLLYSPIVSPLWSRMDPLNGLAHRGPLPTPTRPRAPTSSLRGLSLLHFPCPRPASVYANPRGGGNICLASAPHFLSRWESGGECGGAGPTAKHEATDRLRRSQLQPPAPHPSPNHFDSQEAEDAPDMPLSLSPSRLDGPHFSCLVSRGPGGQQRLGWGRPTWPIAASLPQFPPLLLPVPLSF